MKYCTVLYCTVHAFILVVSPADRGCPVVGVLLTRSRCVIGETIGCTVNRKVGYVNIELLCFCVA